MPSNIKSIWGSNDDVNWTKITTGNETFRGNDRLEFKNLDNPNYYKYHAIVADAFTRLKEVKLFGIRNQGSSTLHDGALTLTKNLDVPRIGPPLDADDTPRRDRLVVEYNTSTNPVEDGLVQDTSGRGNDGVFYGGASYDATEKALVFDGTTSDQYVHTLKNGTSESGNINYSVSLWFNPTTVNVARWRAVFAIGVLDRTQPTDNNGDEITLFVNNGTNALHLQNGGSSVNTGALNAGQWVHVVVTYDGTNRKIYLDGSLSISNGYTTLNLPNEMLIRLAQSIPNGNAEQDEYMDCKISNFKAWFGASLTAEEVKTLYDMGRCDEGGHIVNFSKTRVGIGLGDEEVPQAALDVRGDASFGSKVDVNGNIKSRGNLYLAPGTLESDTKVGTSDAFLLMHHNTYNGVIGTNNPRPECGTIMTNRSGGGTFPWLMYTGLVKDVASTTPATSLRMDWGQGSSTGAATDLVDATLNPLMTLRFSGQFGIGTTTPSNTMHIYKASEDQTTGLFIEKATGASGTASIFFGVTAASGETNNVGVPKAGIFFQRTAGNGRGDLKICVDNVDDTNAVGVADAKITIKGTGDVGIGTDAPGAKLHVNGGIKSGGYVTTTGISISMNNEGWFNVIDFRSYTYGRRRNFIQGYKHGLSLAGNATFYPVTDTANWACTVTNEFNYGGVTFRVSGNYVQA